jgi:hypothetical protein
VTVPSGVQLAEMRRQVACTGIVETSIGKMALVEKLDTHESQFLAVDQSAYGFRLAGISVDFVTLERDGMQFALNIGENKPDNDPNAKPAATPQPNAQPAAQPTPQPTPQPTTTIITQPAQGRFPNGGNRGFRGRGN